jgi:high affinity Mn2+ porin
LEYLYDHLGKASGTFPSGAGYESTTIDLNSLRLGLNRKLDWTNEAASSRDVGDPRAIDPISWNVHGQLTFIEQGYPAFRSPYQGTNSLTGANQIQNTTSATAFVGYRPWDGTEIYINPELMQGFGLNNTLGVAGFPNGEAQKSNFPIPRIDIARVFVRQTFGLGGEQETVEDGPNQLAGKQDISRITVTAGRFAVLDIFEGNTYSHDPRVDFLNWNMYCCGSYDVTMDKIGYTWGAAVELNQKSWAFRTGYFLVPVVSNVNSYDTHILERGEYIGELELRYSLFAQPGKLRLMGWANIAEMGSYAEALAMPVTTPNYPDITQTRQVRANYGFVANMEQAITGDLGIFSRASWSPGLVELIGWTDCDESFSFGTVLKGNAWGRPDDRIGVAGVVEGLSPIARAYFAAGGLGILIGDGELNYRPEQILEAYYAYSLNQWATLTFDYQFIDNPGYNADRGPVSVFSGRLHAQF